MKIIVVICYIDSDEIHITSSADSKGKTVLPTASFGWKTGPGGYQSISCQIICGCGYVTSAHYIRLSINGCALDTIPFGSRFLFVFCLSVSRYLLFYQILDWLLYLLACLSCLSCMCVLFVLYVFITVLFQLFLWLKILSFCSEDYECVFFPTASLTF